MWAFTCLIIQIGMYFSFNSGHFASIVRLCRFCLPFDLIVFCPLKKREVPNLSFFTHNIAQINDQTLNYYCLIELSYYFFKALLMSPIFRNVLTLCVIYILTIYYIPQMIAVV